MIVPVVLCGGSGTRLWPISRKDKPKPFLPLLGERTLFQETLQRTADAGIFADPVIVTGDKHLEHVEDQASVLDRTASIIVEPEGKNTAAAIALAASRLDPSDVMLVCPSDHHVANHAAFVAAARQAEILANDGWLVAFGIEAHSPETGFGYIKRGEPIADRGFAVERFVEKPDRERAERFLADGGYSWNGGLFCFTAGRFLDELKTYRPALAQSAVQSVADGKADSHRFHPDASHFGAIESESIDYAVMEETDRAAVVPVDMGWSDIGNWVALREASERDEHGNAVTGDAELVDCNDVMVHSDGPHVSVIGLEGVTVVVSGDRVLVTSDDGAQKVGKLQGAAQP